MLFNDLRLTIDKDVGIKKTSDGYLTAFARVARSGIQEYLGSEVGKPEVAVVRVYRPPEEVFNVDAMHSMAYRPITFNHPKVAVDASNWREFSRGLTGGDVVRDGEFIRVPMTLMDAGVIKKVEDGDAVELSMGYSTELVWDAGITPNGEPYDAIQTQIRANHLAVVPAARGGPELRIGDTTGDDDMDLKDQLRSVNVDGIDIQVVGDISMKVLARALEAMGTKIAGLTKQIGEADEAKKKTEKDAAAAADAAKVALDTANGKITALEKQLKDAEITPAKLDAMVKDRQTVIDAGRKIVPKLVGDGKSLGDIKREVVTAKLGDAAVKDMSDAAIDGAFSAITAGAASTARPAPTNFHQSATALGDTATVSGDARDAAYEKRVNRLGDAWKTAGKAA